MDLWNSLSLLCWVLLSQESSLAALAVVGVTPDDLQGPFDPKYSSGTPAEVCIQRALGIWKKLTQQGVVGLTCDI